MIEKISRYVVIVVLVAFKKNFTKAYLTTFAVIFPWKQNIIWNNSILLGLGWINQHMPILFRSVQSLSHVQLFVTIWTAAHQASLSITNSRSLLKLTSLELVMPSNHIILCYPLLLHLQSFPASGSFPMSKFFAGGQTIGVSASASGLPMNIQDWFPLGWTGWISLQSKGLSRVFSNTTVQRHQFFSAQLSLLSNSHIHKWPLEKP